jgi:hypothetical protein
MSLIRVSLDDQKVSFLEKPDIYSGDVNTDEVEFSFCDMWAGYAKTAVFYVNKIDPYKVDLDEENRAVIPHEVLTEPGKMFFGVYGVNGDKRLTSAVVAYKVGRGAITTGKNSSSTPADPFVTLRATHDGAGNVTLTIGGN